MNLNALITKVRQMSPPDTIALELADAVEAYISTNDEDYEIDRYLDALGEYDSEHNITSKLGISPVQLSVTINGIMYPSLMHAFQAHKERYTQDLSDKDMADKDAIVTARMKEYTTIDLTAANHKGRHLNLDIKAWDEEKDDIMYSIISKCLEQDDDVKHKLMMTTNDIVEDTLPDEYWGGRCNNLGKSWMRLRTEIKARCESSSESVAKRKRNCE